MTKTLDLRWAENFLCAGSSALLISVPHVLPELWFFSLFALIPFLWRVTRASLKESLALGGLLAVSYAFVAYSVDSCASSGPHLFTLASLILLFAIYAALVSGIKKHFGFNAIFVAALWLPIEYVIGHHTNLGYLFAVEPNESGLIFRFGSLFGLLTVSFVVVIVNALILTTVRRILRTLRSRDVPTITGRNRVFVPSEAHLFERGWYFFPDVRAPPPGSTVL